MLRKGQARNRGNRSVLLVASLLALRLPQETNLSADYTCTFISIYILNITKFKLKHN